MVNDNCCGQCMLLNLDKKEKELYQSIEQISSTVNETRQSIASGQLN